MGDAEKPELTKQFNEGYKTDLAEPGEAPGGKDEISEVKLWTPLRGGLPVGVGRADTGGNPGSVGDKFAFGNTEERARLANMGCKQRGFRGQRAFDHTTGQGYVKSQRGHTTMMGSSPNETSSTCFSTRHSAAASRRLQLQRSTALRARLNARALTAPRTLPTPASHLCHTTRNASPSLRSVNGVNRAILDRRAKLASELSRRA